MTDERAMLLQLLDEPWEENLKKTIFIDCLKKSESPSQIEECLDKLSNIRMKIKDMYGFIEDIFFHDSHRLMKYVERLQKILGDTKENNLFLADLVYRYFSKIKHEDRSHLERELKRRKYNLPDETRKEVMKRLRKGERKEKEKIASTKPVEANKATTHQLTPQQLAQIYNAMPILAYLTDKIIKKRCFQNSRFLIILHFLKDLIPFVECCEKLGLDSAECVLFYKEYIYPDKDLLISYFKNKKYNVAPLDSMNRMLTDFQEKSVKEPKQVVIIEDGGYLVPKLHSEFLQLNKLTIGAVEQTRDGIREDEKIDPLIFPVISVPDSKLKNRYEPPHVARSVINNIQSLLSEENFSAQRALVIGYGAVGEEIAKQLKVTLRMNVTVCDKDPNSLVTARQDGFDTESYCVNAVKEKSLIVGATGKTPVGRAELLAMKNNTYVVSASSGQKEVELFELKALSEKKEDIIRGGRKIGTKYIIRGTDNSLNLIADGFPINFWASNSMPDKVSDLIMSLIFISAIEIATNHESLHKGIDRNKVNELADKYEIAKLYLELYHA